MDATQETRCREMLDQILAMATKMVSGLEACNADLKALNAAFRTAPPTFVADSDGSDGEVDATSGTGYNSGRGGSALVVHSASASPIPSPISTPPHKADPGFQLGVAELADTRDPPVSILFNADKGDKGDVDRLPDSLLRDIVARLPIKDAARTAVLSCRWNPISGTSAFLHLGHLGLRFHGVGGAVPREHFDHLLDATPTDGLAEQAPASCGISFVSASASKSKAAAMPVANYDPSSYIMVANWDSASVTARSNRMLGCTRSSHLAPNGKAARGPAPIVSSNPREEIHYLLVGNKEQLSCATPTEFLSSMHTRCSMLCLYQTSGNELHTTSEVSASSEDIVSLCPAASTGDAYNVFKVMPAFLFLPPSSWYSVWNLDGAYKGDDKFLKSPWPPPLSVLVWGNQVEGIIIELRPIPWPSFCYSCCKVELQYTDQLVLLL